MKGSNNTNKFSPQELIYNEPLKHLGSNNTNKFSPQERKPKRVLISASSNNTNKFSPQEPTITDDDLRKVQIIQINLVLKNH